MVNQELLGLMHCPQCFSKLKAKSGALACVGCHVKYPLIDQIPWLFARPYETLVDWRNRADFQIKSHAFEVQKIDQAIKTLDDSAPPSRKVRLQQLRRAHAHNMQSISDLAKPLFSVRDMSHGLHQAVKTQIPLAQKFMAYSTNLFRDWVWGDEENLLTLEALLSLGKVSDGMKVLVLGSGSSRLAYDLHQATGAGLTVALDINPLLLMIARVLACGSSLRLFEFPLAPKALCDVAVSSDLKAPQASREGLEFVLANGIEAPFGSNTFDVVVTPWFVDVIPYDLFRLSQRINRILKANGQWWNFGPYGFLQASIKEQNSLEEVLETVNQSGFRLSKHEVKNIPYLRSPHSAQQRFEQVLAFNAEKVEHREIKEFYRHIPEWLEDFDKLIPRSPDLDRYLFATQVQYQVLASIDGSTSINTLAEPFAKAHNISREEAQGAISSLLMQVLEL